MMATTTTPGFLRLPLEIRQQIYHYLLAQDFQSRAIKITVRQRRSGGYKLQGLESIQGMVFVSSTFHDEVLTYCFGHFTFFLHNDSESIRFVVREFCRQIGLENRKLVKRITVPNFSIERVLLHQANMVALFASSQARFLQLLDDIQRMFVFLERLPALEELDLGINSTEAMRLGDGSSWYANRYHYVQSHRTRRNERPTQGCQRAYDSHIVIALQDARWLPARVTVGICWTSVLGESSPDTNEETAESREGFLHQIREELAPLRVMCKGVV
jgi:hypothetical protein